MEQPYASSSTFHAMHQPQCCPLFDNDNCHYTGLNTYPCFLESVLALIASLAACWHLLLDQSQPSFNAHHV